MHRQYGTETAVIGGTCRDRGLFEEQSCPLNTSFCGCMQYAERFVPVLEQLTRYTGPVANSLAIHI